MQPTLSYFGMWGRAEASRLFLHAKGISFHDQLIEEAEEWEALKKVSPFGVLPKYTDGDVVIWESQAILRYLARKLHAYKNDAEVTRLDITQEYISECQENLWRFGWAEGHFSNLAQYADETLTPRLQRLADWYADSTTDWNTPGFGADVTHVDCLAFSYLDHVQAFFPTVFAEFQSLVELHAHVSELSGVDAYLRSGDRPPVLCFGLFGPKVDPRHTALTTDYKCPWSKPLDLNVLVTHHNTF